MMKLCYFVLFVNVVITIFMNQEVIMVLGICQSVFLYGQIFMWPDFNVTRSADQNLLKCDENEGAVVLFNINIGH